MGLRGPAPKPTVIKRREGNPGKRKLNESEPTPDPFGRMGPPKRIKDNPRALAEWRKLIPMLRRAGVLKDVDHIALANLCFDLAMLESAAESLAKTPLLVQTKKTGVFHQNPLIQIVGTLTDRVNRTLREFGMTPAGRSGITLAEPLGESDPWADL